MRNLLFTRDDHKVLYTAIVVTALRFFSNIRFSYIVPFLGISPTIRFSPDEINNLAYYWMITLFTGLVSGALILGYLVEKKGLLPLSRIVVFGTILPCVWIFILGVNDDHFVRSTNQLICIRYINAFFHPGAYVVTAIILMRTYEKEMHLKIGAYITLGAILGMQATNLLFEIQEHNLFLFCCLLLGSSVFAASICIKCAKGLNPELIKFPLSQSKPKLSIIALALFIGSAFNTSIRYHYFFVDKHVIGTLFTQQNENFSYIYFYVFLNISMFIYANFFKHQNQFKILSLSLTGILLIGIAPAFFPINSLFSYASYQISFAIFVAGFLSTSISVIYSLFEHDSYPVFHSTMWFSTGYAVGNLMNDWIAEQYGFFLNTNFLSMIPLMISGFCCLMMLITKINNDLVNCSKKEQTNKNKNINQIQKVCANEQFE